METYYLKEPTQNGTLYLPNPADPFRGDFASALIAKGLLAPTVVPVAGASGEALAALVGLVISGILGAVELARFGMEAAAYGKKDSPNAYSLTVEVANLTTNTLIPSSFSADERTTTWIVPPKLIQANEKSSMQVMTDGSPSVMGTVSLSVFASENHSVPVSFDLAPLSTNTGIDMVVIDGKSVRAGGGAGGVCAVGFLGKDGYPSFVLSWSAAVRGNQSAIVRSLQLTPFTDAMPDGWVERR